MHSMKRLSAPVAVWVAALLLAGCAGFPTTAEQVRQATPAAPELEIQSWRTEQGAKVLFVPSPALPMLDVRLVMDAGSARDGDLPGVAALTSALLGEGAKGLSVDEIARGFEDRGARFSTGSYQDMGVISLRTLSRPRWRKDRGSAGAGDRLAHFPAGRPRPGTYQRLAGAEDGEAGARAAGRQGVPAHGRQGEGRGDS